MEPGQDSVDAAAPDDAGRLVRRILVIAIAAVVLGFAIQLLMLAAKLSFGLPFTATGFILDVTQGVTWSLLVCTGVGLITSIAKARFLLAGLLAAVAAPLSIAIAKGTQKAMAGALSAAEQQAVLSLSTISILKSLEYAALGWLLARLVQRGEGQALPYLARGLAIGVVFGGAISALTHQVALGRGIDPGMGRLAASLINEVLFPIGCATVIYVGQLAARSVKAASGA